MASKSLTDITNSRCESLKDSFTSESFSTCSADRSRLDTTRVSAAYNAGGPEQAKTTTEHPARSEDDDRCKRRHRRLGAERSFPSAQNLLKAFECSLFRKQLDRNITLLDKLDQKTTLSEKVGAPTSPP